MTQPKDRKNCVVPGCRRTCPPDEYDEWICAKHWPLVPKAMRKRYLRYRRRALRDHRWVGVSNRMWARCKTAAIGNALSGGF